MVLRGRLGLPARLDHDRLVILADEGRAHDAHARLEAFAKYDGCLVPSTMREECARRLDVRRRIAHLELGLLCMLATALSRHLDGLDLDLLARTDESVTLLM